MGPLHNEMGDRATLDKEKAEVLNSMPQSSTARAPAMLFKLRKANAGNEDPKPSVREDHV